MGRIICIDFGLKRTGIAVTDPLRIIATALTTVDTKLLMAFVEKYCAAEVVDLFLVGHPLNLDDSETHATAPANAFVEALQKKFPQKPVLRCDERFTSSMAKRSMIEMGMKKADRRIKGNVDQIAATIMLQEYLAKDSL